MDWEKLVRIARWLRRPRRERLGALLLIMFLCFILTIVARYVFTTRSLNEEASLIAWICARCGRDLCLARTRRSPLRYFLQLARRRARCVCTVIRHCAIVLLGSRSRGHQLRHVPEGRTLRLSRRPARHLYSIYILFSSASSFAMRLYGARWRPSARHRNRCGSRAMMNPFGVCIVTILGPRTARIADRYSDDRRLDSLSAAGGPRPRHLASRSSTASTTATSCSR